MATEIYIRNKFIARTLPMWVQSKVKMLDLKDVVGDSTNTPFWHVS